MATSVEMGRLKKKKGLNLNKRWKLSVSGQMSLNIVLVDALYSFGAFVVL